MAAPKRKKNLSAIKKARQDKKHQERNKAVKTGLKTVSKKVARSVAEGNPEAREASLKEAITTYARAASKGIIHRKTASRKISRLTKLAKTKSA